MQYEIIKTYDHKHVRCMHYEYNRIKQHPEFTQLLPVLKTMFVGESINIKSIFNYELYIERVE